MEFPVFVCKEGAFDVRHSEDCVFVCSSLALKKGYYKGLEIIDSKANLYHLKDAEFVRGEGPFFGYNIFFNRTLRVRPVLLEQPIKVAFEEIKRRAIYSLKHKSRWKTRGDYPRLVSAVSSAETLQELVQAFESE